MNRLCYQFIDFQTRPNTCPLHVSGDASRTPVDLGVLASRVIYRTGSYLCNRIVLIISTANSCCCFVFFLFVQRLSLAKRHNQRKIFLFSFFFSSVICKIYIYAECMFLQVMMRRIYYAVIIRRMSFFYIYLLRETLYLIKYLSQKKLMSTRLRYSVLDKALYDSPLANKTVETFSDSFTSKHDL